MYAWVDNTVQSLYPHPDRFLEVVDALGDPLMKALERHNPLQRNILPRIAKAREKQMSVQIPNPGESNSAASRPRF